ncbi:MAG: hypothetical protein AAGK92_06030 [Pseudomonadota bacterium]
MSVMNTDIYTSDGALDTRAIENKARALRAQATRDMFRAIVAVFKPKATDAKGTQNA